MSVTTTYTCDACKQKLEHGALWEIMVKYRSVGRYGGAESTHNGSNPIHWCKDCMTSNGIISRIRSKDDNNPVPKVPTFEELVRDIVAQELENNVIE